jgi:hypothetical protein
MNFLNVGGAVARRVECAIADRDAVAAFTVLRVGTAMVLLVKSFLELPFIQTIYGPSGVLPWTISDHATLTIYPKLSVIALALSHVGIGPDATVVIVFAAYVAALFGMLAAVQYRLPVFIVWYLHLVFYAVSFKSVYGLDCFANIALFYCLIGPGGDWRALVRDPQSRAPRSYVFGLLQSLLQLNVCIVYASAAWAKSHGVEWWTGESIWRAVAQPQFTGILSMLWLHQFPLLAKLAGWATVCVEGAYPFAVWVPILRRPALLAIILMHLSIGIVLGLHLFSAIMIVLNLAAFGVPESRWFARVLVAALAGKSVGRFAGQRAFRRT